MQAQTAGVNRHRQGDDRSRSIEQPQPPTIARASGRLPERRAPLSFGMRELQQETGRAQRDERSLPIT